MDNELVEASFTTASGERLTVGRTPRGGLSITVDQSADAEVPVAPVTVELDDRTASLLGDTLLVLTVHPAKGYALPPLWTDTALKPVQDKALKQRTSAEDKQADPNVHECERADECRYDSRCLNYGTCMTIESGAVGGASSGLE